ncbi:hypothetical protein [Synechococcus sp. MIT S9508]|uniref:hypothetical protein n=1 Tax=Synechococcus sp. MIT S9508 TaxID=1801629 RepID=UPI00082AA396
MLRQSSNTSVVTKAGLSNQWGDVWPQVMARKIQLPLSKRPSSITTAWATLTFAYIAAWALWGLANAYPSI